jgi:acyl-CoA thioesterase FadM
VRKAEVEYEGSAKYDDEIDVCVRVERLGRSSFDFRVEIHRAEELLVSGRVVYVNADPVARKSAPVPEFLRQAIKAFEHTAPAETNRTPA